MNMSIFGGNYVDLIIILILIYFASEAFRHGVWVILVDFISFLGSLLISLRAYKFAAELLRDNFALNHSVSNAIGFLLTAIIAEAILGFVLANLMRLIPEKLLKHKLSKVLGLIPAIGEGIVIIAFILTLVVSLPVAPNIKKDVTESQIGSYILGKTSGAERAVNEIFGGVIEDSLTYLTVKPGSKESISLTSEIGELKEDPQAETQMFSLVNDERKKVGKKELTWASEIVPVARAHAKDMWVRRYFGHVSPEGKDVGDRLGQGGIKYFLAGENLALAPTIKTAHTGLMNSEGHRANILEQKFNKIGIGVIDNGIYGKMFVQVFTD